MELRPTESGLDFSELVSLFGPDLLAGSNTGPEDANLFIRGMAVDSRRVQPGDLFAALSGVNEHGARFVPDAVARGAVAVLTDETGLSLIRDGLVDTPPLLVLVDPRAAVGAASAQIYGRPGDHLLMLGVTGTNGKTTTTWMLEHALRAAGHVTGLIGTVETQIAGQPVPSVRTTPEAPELHALLAVMRERSVTAVAIEVSSHAMTMGRIDGCVFDVVGFTQFGTDHLDFHGSESAYFDAKRALFDRHFANQAVVCIDSDGGRQLVREVERANLVTRAGGGLPIRTVVTADEFRSDADWRATELSQRSSGGYSFVVKHGTATFPAEIKVPGRFNVANVLVAGAMLHAADSNAVGIDDETTFQALAEFGGVPGRMEVVDSGQAFTAIVDYAHTPDALTAVLESLRFDTKGRLMIAFGCGGDRDASKRANMGEVAARLADVVMVTDDNPRSEDPAEIRAEILRGARVAGQSSSAAVTEVAGRAEAIRALVAEATSGDVVVVAGKGHEQGQEVDGEVLPFDDRTVLASALNRRGQ